MEEEVGWRHKARAWVAEVMQAGLAAAEPKILALANHGSNSIWPASQNRPHASTDSNITNAIATEEKCTCDGHGEAIGPDSGILRLLSSAVHRTAQLALHRQHAESTA